MTEKRFILDDDGIVTDMVDLSMYIDNEDCCEKLNELNDENEQLLKENRELKFELKECRNNKLFSRRQLEKEKEQLKSKNKILLEHCDDLQERNDRQAETIRELYALIENKDWKGLTAHIEELNKAEEQLLREWRCYE